MKNNRFKIDNGDGGRGRREPERDPIIDLLTPKVSPPLPPGIKTNVLSRIRRRQALKNFFTMKNRFSKIVASTAAVAAVAAVAVVAISVKPATARAAEVKTILDRSIARAAGVRTMVMKIDVRTREHESFAYTNPALQMVEHTLSVVVGEPLRWRLEKGRRTVVFDGTDKYMWIDGVAGYRGDENTAFEEWFDMLLDPQMVPIREKSAQREGVKYRIEESGDRIVLRADVKAKGDFSNDYMRNSSIEESDTRREIVFDRETGLLKGLRIFAKVAGVRRLVVDVKSIDYDLPLDTAAITALPEGYEWRDAYTTPATGKFAGITAGQAARLIADAITSGDIASVGDAFANYDLAAIRKRFEGARVVETGEPFRSGMYPGVFVPYRLRLADGSVEKLKIALRNDNPGRVWLVDGGI